MNLFSSPERAYTRILLPKGLSDTDKLLIEKSPFYNRIKRYTHSLRYRGFTKKEKSIFLAAASEIVADKLSANQIDFFASGSSFDT